MSWYIHPSRHLDGDELPPELVLTSGDGSVSQAYVPYNASDKLMDENEQLRKLCKPLIEYTSQDRCEGCACKSRCNDGEIDECWMLAEIREIASELGMVVD